MRGRLPIARSKRGRPLGALTLACATSLLGGCLREDADYFPQTWDGQPTEWEAAPSRVVYDDGGVVSGDGGGSVVGGSVGAGGGFGGVGSGGGDYAACTKRGQAHCCYDGKPLTGAPECGWRRLNPGQASTFTRAFRPGMKDDVDLPVNPTIQSASPPRFSSRKECNDELIGFVVKAPGIREGRLISSISHYYIKTDGTWVYTGGGATSGLVAGDDTNIGTKRDGGQPTWPTYTLGGSSCDDDRSEIAAYVVKFSEVWFWLGMTEYRADFDRAPNGNISGYYAVIDRAY